MIAMIAFDDASTKLSPYFGSKGKRDTGNLSPMEKIGGR
jgi:hypothetical protein